MQPGASYESERNAPREPTPHAHAVKEQQDGVGSAPYEYISIVQLHVQTCCVMESARRGEQGSADVQ